MIGERVKEKVGDCCEAEIYEIMDISLFSHSQSFGCVARSGRFQ
jgi:hypothetical protein